MGTYRGFGSDRIGFKNLTQPDLGHGFLEMINFFLGSRNRVSKSGLICSTNWETLHNAIKLRNYCLAHDILIDELMRFYW